MELEVKPKEPFMSNFKQASPQALQLELHVDK